MNSEEYIATLKHANPRLFQAVNIQMTPQELERQLRRAYAAGAEAMLHHVDKQRGDGIPEFLRGMFK